VMKATRWLVWATAVALGWSKENERASGKEGLVLSRNNKVWNAKRNVYPLCSCSLSYDSMPYLAPPDMV
jgi:hypothetical protein